VAATTVGLILGVQQLLRTDAPFATPEQPRPTPVLEQPRQSRSDPVLDKEPNPLPDQDSAVPGSRGGMEITANSTVAQTFSVSKNGVLYQIDIIDIKHHRCTPSKSLYISLIDTDGQELGISTIRTWEIHSDKVSNNIVRLTNIEKPVKSGEQYAIVLESSAEPSGCTYAWGGGIDTYDGGSAFINGAPNSRDMKLRTYVR
jgi:hypothetical protein